MELTEVWDIAKEAIIPLIGVIWVVFKQKIDDIASDLDKMEDKYRELEKKLDPLMLPKQNLLKCLTRSTLH